jgi:ABC-type nickel/cobalt efflux system permease component RcnA
MRASLRTVAVLLLLSAPVCAHPIPKDNHDRTIVVHLLPGGIVVDYRLEVDGLTAAIELRKVRRDLPPSTEVRQLAEAYLQVHAAKLANNLVVTLDGKELELRCTRQSFQVLDHLRCDFRFRADWSPEAGKKHDFTLQETNYHDDDFSRLALRLTAESRVQLVKVVAPDEALIARPASERRSGDGDRLRNLQATFTVVEREPPAVCKLALPPDLPALDESVELQGVGRDGPGDAERSAAKPAADGEASVGKFGFGKEPLREPPLPETAPAPAATRPGTLLDLILDTRMGLTALLLLAAGFGAVHALTPGHGKTMVAAYLVGERGTVWHAIVLGVVTTLTHTAAVLLLAALLPLFFSHTSAASLQMALELIGGLLIAGLGLWLLLRRLAGQADHVHLSGPRPSPPLRVAAGGGGGHSHGPVAEVQPVGWWALVVLGVSGGIVPCWDAIAMLGLAISSQRLWLGLPLLLAFSAGLAAVLVALGISVVVARKYAGARWGGEERFRGVVRVLPLVSAVLILVMGLWLCYDGVHGSHQ